MKDNNVRFSFSRFLSFRLETREMVYRRLVVFDSELGVFSLKRSVRARITSNVQLLLFFREWRLSVALFDYTPIDRGSKFVS